MSLNYELFNDYAKTAAARRDDGLDGDFIEEEWQFVNPRNDEDDEDSDQLPAPNWYLDEDSDDADEDEQYDDDDADDDDGDWAAGTEDADDDDDEDAPWYDDDEPEE